MDKKDSRLIACGCLVPVAAASASLAVGIIHGAGYGLMALAGSALLAAALMLRGSR